MTAVWTYLYSWSHEGTLCGLSTISSFSTLAEVKDSPVSDGSPQINNTHQPAHLHSTIHVGSIDGNGNRTERSPSGWNYGNYYEIVNNEYDYRPTSDDMRSHYHFYLMCYNHYCQECDRAVWIQLTFVIGSANCLIAKYQITSKCPTNGFQPIRYEEIVMNDCIVKIGWFVVDHNLGSRTGGKNRRFKNSTWTWHNVRIFEFLNPNRSNLCPYPNPRIEAFQILAYWDIWKRNSCRSNSGAIVQCWANKLRNSYIGRCYIWNHTP